MSACGDQRISNQLKWRLIPSAGESQLNEISGYMQLEEYRLYRLNGWLQ